MTVPPIVWQARPCGKTSALSRALHLHASQLHTLLFTYVKSSYKVVVSRTLN